MKKRTTAFLALGVIAAVLFFAATDSARSSDRRGNGGAQLSKTTGTPVSTLININNLSGWIRNDGWSARNPSTGNSGVTFPRGTATAIYQDGIVWGGNVNDGGSQALRVGGQTYNIGTDGGRIISAGVAADPNSPDVRVYRIRRDYKTADLRQDAAELLSKALGAVTDGDIAQIRAQYETDWNEWPASQGAPYYDRDSNGVYDPTVDEPGVADADQVIWFVSNDLNPGRTNALYGSNPIGLELQVTLWGYNRTDPLANVYFKKFTFIYKGTATTIPSATITDMYACQWSDPDLGDSGDDFAGCDTTLSLVYAYNGGAVDNNYAAFGLKPPAIGYDFFQGPIHYTNNLADTAIFGLKKVAGAINLPMTAAFYFAAGGTYSDPPFTRDGSIQWYNLLRGLTPISGAPFAYPGYSASTFWLDGDPVAGTGRLDGTIDQPGDRRIGACSGPFSMAVGDTQEIVVAVVAGIGTSYLNSVSLMKNNDAAAQNAYNSLFVLPKAPPNPDVQATALDQKIILNWGSNDAAVKATEEFDRQGYTFEGYNLYQLPSASAGFDQGKKLATYDLVDGVRTITDQVFDPALGTIITKVLQTGTDAGVQRVVPITQDAIRQAPLVNGQRYYFAVTAYGYNPSDVALTHALESSLLIKTVVPQTPNPGVRYSSSYGDTVKNITHNGPSDGSVVAIVVDPTRLTGHQYKVTFKVDSVSGNYLWDLRDVTRGVVILGDQTNQAGDANYLNVDGLQIIVAGPAPGMKDWSWDGPARHWTWANGDWGSEGFNGAIGNGYAQWFSSSTITPDKLKNVEIQFATTDANGNILDPNDGNASFAYRYLRGAQSPPQQPWFAPIPNPGSSFNYQEYSKTMPFAAYDVEANPPRRLMVGYSENNVANGLADGKYWPPYNADATYGDNIGSGGPREWFFIFDGDYSTTPDAALQVNILNNTLPVMWFGTITRRDQAAWSAPDKFEILANHINSVTDDFTFAAPSAASYSDNAAKADISQINVFPNPYYGFNRAETSRTQRFVRFNHLPPRAEVRIFNLAGVLVRADQKDDPTQYFDWDLNNQNGFPVASGVYIVYVNMPEIGATKTLKLIIVQEQQYLDNF